MASKSDAPSRVDWAKNRVTVARQRVDATRTSIPSVDTAFTVYEHEKQVRGNLLACAVAYRFFLWLLPLSLLVAAVLGFLRDAGRGVPTEAAKELGLGAYITSTVVSASSQANKSRWILLAVALFGLYSASSAGAKTVRTVSAIAWGIVVKKPRRAWLPGLAFAAVVGAMCVMTIGANWVRHQSVGLGLGVRIALLVVFIAFAWVAQLLLPHKDVPVRWLLPGAVLLAVGGQLLHLFTVLYLANKLKSSSELYGGLGAAATVLLWLYLLGRLVVVAAVFNATVWERHEHRAGN